MPLITKTIIEKPQQVTSFKINPNLNNHRIESIKSEEKPYQQVEVKSMIQTPYRYPEKLL